tara:strand:+ start:393023 stop:393472 length:450 start_codon:yes stop_codon:yes gene_type:complete
MLNLIKTNTKNPDFIHLVKLLDADLAVRDGDDHAFYNQFNSIDNLKYAIVAYKGNIPVACGAIKEFSKDSVEIKRIYVLPTFRGQQIAQQILTELERCAKELNYSKCILETGYNQPEAIKLYNKCNYRVIENYGQYKGIATSICFEKIV